MIPVDEPVVPRLRPVLDRLPRQGPGTPAVSADGRCYRLAANESAFSPLPSVCEAITSAAAEVHRYPDNACTTLATALARRLGVSEKRITIGCGSAGVLQMLLEAVAEPGTNIVYAWRSFEAYPLLVRLSGAIPVQVPLTNQRHDLDAMAKAVTATTRAVIICNPNNPTGTALRRDELEAFLDRVPSSCLVILDEAYREYVRDQEIPDGLELLPWRPNLAVVRTFSKAYGLAGLRVGYLVAHPDVAAAVRTARLPFSVSSIAQAAAVASLEAGEELLARVETTVTERDRLRHGLLAQGWAVPASHANFLWLPAGDATADLAAAFTTAGINVRVYEGEGLRITTGTAVENDVVLAVAAHTAAQRRTPVP